jgi:hypothetical protein
MAQTLNCTNTVRHLIPALLDNIERMDPAIWLPSLGFLISTFAPD